MKKSIKKRAFVFAMVMLMVTTVALTSSTFAWFTMADSTDVEAMNLTVSSIEGVQISANASTWTASLTCDEIFNQALNADHTAPDGVSRNAAYYGNTNIYPDTLTPVSSAFSSADSSTGFANFYKSAISGGATTANVTAVAQNETAGFIAFDLFFRVDSESAATQKIFFDESVFTDGSEGQKAPTALRVAFTPLGTVTDTTSATVTDDSIALNSFVSADTVSYEVDSLNRSEAATQAGVSTGAQATKYLNSTATGVAVSNGVLNTGATISGTAVDDQDDATAKYFELPVGITKVRVYIWMEGQDVDCLNSVAGSSLVADLKFTIE